MARRRVNTTKYEIIQLATKLFLELGYSSTTPRMICDELDISTGNLTYYFPTKEHLLAVLVDMLCDFQLKTVRDNVEEGKTSLFAVCMEFATMAAMTEEDEIARDLFHAIYSSPMCLEVIQKNDTERSKKVYKDFCPNWTHENFAQAEVLVSGLEFATMMTSGDSVPLETRIAGALNSILQIFNVSDELRQQKISKVLAQDYRTLGGQVLDSFREFVEQTNEQTFEELLSKKK